MISQTCIRSLYKNKTRCTKYTQKEVANESDNSSGISLPYAYYMGGNTPRPYAHNPLVTAADNAKGDAWRWLVSVTFRRRGEFPSPY